MCCECIVLNVLCFVLNVACCVLRYNKFCLLVVRVASYVLTVFAVLFCIHQNKLPLCAVKLSLHDCDFTGTIPTEMGYLWNMTRLQMKNNQFTGEIPGTFGRLAELEQLTLDGNKLTGTIPLEVCDLMSDKLGQFVVDCYNRRSGIGFDCEPDCCSLCRDVS